MGHLDNFVLRNRSCFVGGDGWRDRLDYTQHFTRQLILAGHSTRQGEVGSIIENTKE